MSKLPDKNGKEGRDGRLKLLEMLLANAQLTRTSAKTDPVTAQYASQLEAEFQKKIAELEEAA